MWPGRLFDRGQPLQQLPALRQETLLLLVGQVLGALGVQRDVGGPRRAQGSHGAREEGPGDWGWCSDAHVGVVNPVAGFRGNLQREVMECAGED